jgi:hypothetical protein
VRARLASSQTRSVAASQRPVLQAKPLWTPGFVYGRRPLHQRAMGGRPCVAQSCGGPPITATSETPTPDDDVHSNTAWRVQGKLVRQHRSGRDTHGASDFDARVISQ